MRRDSYRIFSEGKIGNTGQHRHGLLRGPLTQRGDLSIPTPSTDRLIPCACSQSKQLPVSRYDGP